MVDKKKIILELLYRANGGTISGVKISEATDIFRVAVWKHIAALKKSGFAIDSRIKTGAIRCCLNLREPCINSQGNV